MLHSAQERRKSGPDTQSERRQLGRGGERDRDRERERERGLRPVLRLVREEAEATTKPSQPRPQKIEINCFVNMYTFQ